MHARWHAATSSLIGGLLFTPGLKVRLILLSGRRRRVSACFHLMDFSQFNFGL